MTAMVRASVLALVFVAAATASLPPARPSEAATPPGSRPSAAASPILSPAPPAVAAAHPPPPRVVATSVAAALRAATPPFTPVAASRAPAAPEAQSPKNHIVRLPAYVVRGAPVRVPSAREVLTPKARIELAKKLHPGLGPSWLGNDGIGLAMLREQQRLEDMAHFDDLVKATSFQDPKAAAAMKKVVDQAFIREFR